MHKESDSLADILRFQQSLMRLVTQDSQQQATQAEAVQDQTRQLEDWARQVQPQAN
jgi:hypothetical protein